MGFILDRARLGRKMRLTLAVLAIGFCFVARQSPLWADTAAAPAAAAAPATVAASSSAKEDDAEARLEESRHNTIRFGIDAEITDLISQLAGQHDSKYNDDLLALLKTTRSSKLRIAILDYFSGLEWNGAEAQAMDIVDGRDSSGDDLVTSALSYLAAIHSKNGLKFASDLIKEDNKKTLPSLIKLMGRAGGEDEVKLLLDWFDSDSATPPIREEAIKALGEIGSKSAAPRLEKFIADSTNGKAARMFACDALGKIKSDSSVAPLIKASIDADPNVRSSAVDALAAFASTSQDARDAIVQALRDSFVKARIAACKAAASGKIDAALPFLKYKAQSDPEDAVKTEALQALAQMGESGFSFIRERLKDAQYPDSLRSLCFGLLCRYDASGSLALLSETLKTEASAKDRSYYTSLARVIANADKAPDIASLARVLEGDKEYLIRVAAIEWARKTKSADFRADLAAMAAGDPSDMIRKRASAALKEY